MSRTKITASETEIIENMAEEEKTLNEAEVAAVRNTISGMSEQEMKLAAANAIAELVPDDKLCDEYILPDVFHPDVADVVAEAVKANI